MPTVISSRNTFRSGIFTAKEIAAGSHCMTTRFLENQLGRSLKNLAVDCMDVYYLHNPETQLGEVSKEEFLKRVREAFAFLECAADAGKDSVLRHGHLEWFSPGEHRQRRDAVG